MTCWSRIQADYWTMCLAHEAVHAAGYIRGTMVLPPTIGKSLTCTTDAEERIATSGAWVLCRAYGVPYDSSRLVYYGRASGAELVELEGRLRALGFGAICESLAESLDGFTH